jgi:hypothetical protein
MNGRLHGFLDFLDLLAEGQRRQAEVVTGRGFEPQAGIVPVQEGQAVRRDPQPASRYSTARNTSYAAILVAALAGVVSNSLALDQRVILERDVPQAASVAVLPEVVVTASRLEQ